MPGTGRIPLAIALLFACDFGLVLLSVVDFLIGSPSATLRRWLDLNAEDSLPAWYSSVQWFCAALLLALIPAYLWRRQPGWSTRAIAALALVCLLFSVDEILGIHEWLGVKVDALLPGGAREGTALWRTGIWPFAIGLPVVLALGAVLLMLDRRMHGPRRRAIRLLAFGFAVMFSGALILELAGNLVELRPENAAAVLAQLVVEELFEMLGVTLIVWSAWELLLAHGFSMSWNAPAARVGATGPPEKCTVR